MTEIGPWITIWTVKADHQLQTRQQLKDSVNKTDHKRNVNGNNHCENRLTFNWSSEGYNLENIKNVEVERY